MADPSSSRVRAVVRLGERLGSPLALATCVVLLVFAVGSASTLTAYRALRRSAELRAEERLRAQGSELSASLNKAFGVADALLDRLAAYVQHSFARSPAHGEAGASARGQDVHGLESVQAQGALLERMRELATARSGLTWLSVSFPDGAFVGVYVDSQGALKGQASSLGPALGGQSLTFAFDAAGKPTEVAREPTNYDPRRRPFYRLALAQEGRVWTNLYPFLPLLRTGVSRAQAVYREPRAAEGALGPSLSAVLTVDFDASGLAALLRGPMSPSQRQLVVSADGSVLSSWGVALPKQEALSSELALNWSALTDPAVGAARALHSLSSPDGVRTVQVGDVAFRFEQTRVATLGQLPIVLLSLIPEHELFAEARAEARRGLLATCLTALFGVLVSLLLSSSIARLRRKRVEAELAAEQARQAVTELGSYRLIAPIGVGGMGEVFRARHTLLARDAALKLIKQGELGSDADEKARRMRFFDEARMLASLRSVHTVAVYDFGMASDGRYFLAMELLDGLDLDALVRAHGPQPPGRVADILAQVCDSLAEAHAAGLVHRDVKPANVFLCRMAEWLDLVKVLDFGLTRAVGSNAADAVEGTPRFMAPEQALGESVGPLSDLYAVGGIGYWLLTGRPPYDVDSAAEMMAAHVQAPMPELPEPIRANCPPALVQLLTRCMAKRPEHRPNSAEVLARAFRRVASESVESFSPERRQAFWAARTPHTFGARAEDLTQPMASVFCPRAQAPASMARRREQQATAHSSAGDQEQGA